MKFMVNVYKNRAWPIRFLKWLYWKPVYFILGLVDLMIWFSHRMEIPQNERKFFKGKFDYMCHILRCELSIADIKMGNYQTLDEVIAELRAKTT